MALSVDINNQSPSSATAQSPINSSGSTISTGDFIIGGGKNTLPTWLLVAGAAVAAFFLFKKRGGG